MMATLPSLSEADEDRLPCLVKAVEHAGPHGLSLYLGNQPAAEDGALLLAHGITVTLNLAVNIDVAPLTLSDGTAVRRAKIGLIDGPGNSGHHLLAGVLALSGLLAQASPGKPTYPLHCRGHVLVHCRGGRSRSVTVLALYLALAQPDYAGGFAAVLDDLRRRRGLGPDHPTPAMLALAEDLLRDDAVGALFA